VIIPAPSAEWWRGQERSDVKESFIVPDMSLVDSKEALLTDGVEGLKTPWTLNLADKFIYLPANYMKLTDRKSGSYIYTLCLAASLKYGYKPWIIKDNSMIKCELSRKMLTLTQAWGIPLLSGHIPPPSDRKSNYRRGLSSFLNSRYRDLKGLNSGLFKWKGSKSIVTELLGEKDAAANNPGEYCALSSLIYLSKNVLFDDMEIIPWMLSTEQIRKENGLDVIHNTKSFNENEKMFLDNYRSNLGLDIPNLDEVKDVYVDLPRINTELQRESRKLLHYRQVVSSLSDLRQRTVYLPLKKTKKGDKKAKETPYESLVAELDIESFKVFNPSKLLALVGGRAIDILGITESASLNEAWNAFDEQVTGLTRGARITEPMGNTIREAFHSYLLEIEKRMA
jgi:hypothetical protein